MKNPFATDPRSDLAKMISLHAEAEAVVIKRQEAIDRLAAQGAEAAAMEKAATAHDVAKAVVKARSGAVDKAKAEVAALEKRERDDADQALRAKTVAELEVMGKDLTKAANDFDLATTQLAKITERIGVFIPEGLGLSNFCQVAKTEVQPAAAMLKTLLNSHAAAVAAGSGPATLPKPAPAPLPPPPKPELVTVITIKKIAFENSLGLIQTVNPGYAIELLPAVARHALAIGAAVQRDDPRAKFHQDQRSPYTPLIENCTPLDDASKAAVAAAIANPRGNVAPIRRSVPPGVIDATMPPQRVAARNIPPDFQVVEGKPITIKVAPGNPQPPPQPPGPMGNDDEK